MKNWLKRPSPGLALGVAAVVMACMGTAWAAQITGDDIKNGTVLSKDVGNGTLKTKDLSQAAQDDLSGTDRSSRPDGPGRSDRTDRTDGDDGPTGDDGATGPTGPTGPAGADGTATYVGPHWGQIDRNTLGSPTVVLRGGPFVGPSSPPDGDGSLQITANGVPRTPSPTEAEQATFGNEVDFVGDLFADIDELGFHVYTTGENNARGNPNMPVIKMELDSNLTAARRATISRRSRGRRRTRLPTCGRVTSMRRQQRASPSGTGFILSGEEGTVTGCNISTPCTFGQVQNALDDDPSSAGDASLYNVAVGKGRDFAWSGAVDALRVSDTIYDFEPFGVSELPAP